MRWWTAGEMLDVIESLRKEKAEGLLRFNKRKRDAVFPSPFSVVYLFQDRSYLQSPYLIAACAAARRAIGTQEGRAGDS